MKRYRIEIANRIGKLNDRTCAVGTDFVVTRGPGGYTGILVKFATREEAQAWIDAAVAVEAHYAAQDEAADAQDDDAHLFDERQAFVDAQNEARVATDAAADAHEDAVNDAANAFDDGGVQ